MALDGSEIAIVAGVQEPESGQLVLAQALDLAARLDGRVVVAHVEEIPIAAGVGMPASGMAGPPVLLPPEEAVSDEQREAEQSWVHELCEQVAAERDLREVPCSFRHAAGDPGRVLAELAEEADAYCVVVGSRGEGVLAAIGRWFRPSVSRSVLRENCVPVLVVPSAGPVPAPQGADA